VQAVLFLFLQKKDMDNSIEKASQSVESKTYQGKEVRLCSDGKYRWAYEMHLLKNPTIFFTVLKVMMISVGIVWLFGLVIGIGNMSLDYFLFWTKLTGIMIGIFFVLTIIGVLITAAVLGKYVVLFEMDEKEVTHIQMPRQVKKAEVIGLITALVGAMAKSPTTMGAGVLATAKTKSTSEFVNVRRVKARRRFNLIKVNQLFDKNQVYVADEDFDFVYNFIKSRCINAK
jgi:hypothetical protein